MNRTISNNQIIEKIIRPETKLEKRIINESVIRQGMLWGKPRRGHPEGAVINHIQEVLTNVENLNVEASLREQLRLVTILHDTFKYKEVFGQPRDWSMHHAVLARQFAEKYIEDQGLLDVIEWHDDAYYCWRAKKNGRSLEKSSHCLRSLFDRLGDNLELYFLFFKCDTQTGDKTQEPLNWFGERVMEELERRALRN
ncbi:MAG: hypothetical protein ACPG19_00735 [Saprospiraceae bacterium]